MAEGTTVAANLSGDRGTSRSSTRAGVFMSKACKLAACGEEIGHPRCVSVGREEMKMRTSDCSPWGGDNREGGTLVGFSWIGEDGSKEVLPWVSHGEPPMGFLQTRRR